MIFLAFAFQDPIPSCDPYHNRGPWALRGKSGRRLANKSFTDLLFAVARNISVDRAIEED